MSGQQSMKLGQWGEKLAAQTLEKKGYHLLTANWRCRYGEIDLIVEDERYLCFVEVKLRKSSTYGSASAFVDWRKQEKLRTSAQLYLSQYPTTRQPRFDVVEIYVPHGMETREPEIHILENAF